MASDVELKPQVYRDPRPPEYFGPFHERVRAHEPEAKVYEVTRVLTVLHAGEVLVRARDPSRGVTHAEVRRQGTEPRVDPGASAKEDVDVVGG